MIFIIALLLALALTLLCGPALRRCPGAFYAGAAIVSGAVIALYWARRSFSRWHCGRGCPSGSAPSAPPASR